MPSESASNTNRQKRTRIDPTATLPRPVNQKDPQPMSPRNTAEKWISDHVVTLHPQVSSIVAHYGNKFVALKCTAHNKQRQLQRLTQDQEFIPRSARIKFSYSLSDAARATPDYAELLAKTNEEISKFQQTLKAGITQAIQIELTSLEKEIQTLTLKAIHDITKSFLIVEQNGQNLTSLPIENTIKEVVNLSHEELSTHTAIADGTKLIELFNAAFNTTINSIPTAATTNMDDSIALMIQAEATGVPAPTVVTTDTISRCISTTLKAIFFYSWEEFLKQSDKNNVSAQLRRFETEIITGDATSAAAIVIDDEPPADHPTVNKLIQDATSKNTKRLEQAIHRLENKFASLQTNASSSSDRKRNNSSKSFGNTKQKPKAAEANNASSRKKLRNNKHSAGNAGNTKKKKFSADSNRSKHRSANKSN